MRICRVCSIEHKIARWTGWMGTGTCPICKERHILFDVKKSALEHAELIAESMAQKREDLAEHQAGVLSGL